MATQASERLASHPTEDLEAHIQTIESPTHIKEQDPIYIEKVVLNPRIPFAKKRLDLSIYTFDEPPIEQLEEKLKT